MSTAPAAPVAATSLHSGKREIRIISHSNLFYWWPVWAVGFLMGMISFFSGSVMAVAPHGSTWKGESEGNKVQYVLETKNPTSDATPPEPLHLSVSNSKNPGVLFCVVLLLVIVITNVPLRGLWSAIVIGVLIFLSIIFALAGWWDSILNALGRLDIRINTGGYMTIATVLLALWLLVFFLFDEQIYMVFSPGQLRVRLEIGEAETAYDTTGMTIQKQRSDLFRHWVLGLGSGDLIVRTSGAQVHQFDMPNVLFLGRKVREIEEMLRSRQVMAG